jgi:nitrogen fixation protein FixH
MFKSGKLWPYAIAISIALVFSFCIATVMVTKSASIQKSDIYMTTYQDADARANEIIKARMDFDKKYSIKYISDGINLDGTTIKYQITDKNLNPVNDAKLNVLVSRPDNHNFNVELTNPTIKDGIYTFNTIKLAKQGVWDIMAKVNVDKLERFYNLKADTRVKTTFEF